MEKHQNIHQLIVRLLSGEADTHEKKIISDWINLSADNKKLFNDIREIWLTSGSEKNADNYQLEKAINKFREQVKQANQHQAKKINFIPLLRYVAVVVLILSLPLTYYFGKKQQTNQSVVTISCAFGDKSNITLPDSTKVMLNSGSKLTFNPDFKNNGRNVVLEGEAFFSVSNDIENPFRVKAADIEIMVLGTQFNVKAYPEDNTISTTLVEGSIDILANNKRTLIKPNQMLVYNKTSLKRTIYELTDSSSEIGWKDGRLIFRNESLEEMAVKLERWFDVDIVFADEQVKTRRFTGILERESILEVISYFDISKLVECKIQGNKVIIKTQRQ